MRLLRASGLRGFTLVELMVTVGVFAVVGLMVFLVLNTGMVLYAKNTAVNSAHQQARSGVNQMLTNLYSSVSIPQLVDTNLQPVSELSGGQPNVSAGISFQSFDNGPFPVVANANATDTFVVLNCPGYAPAAGVRLNIPSHGIEYDVASTVALGSYRRFNLNTPAGGIGTAINISGSGIEGQAGVSYIITGFITRRESYAVIGTELRYFPDNNLSNYSVIARNITSATPFTVPLLPGGGIQNQFLAAVNLSSVEPNYSNRGYAAVNLFINSMIPFRCRLTDTQ
ncbi:MAG TPA: prepilin-type N-terminal cleavage/methylation domain-containing protein [Chthoniobacterales bacterium]|jgi:prepilin-type N-terminal cleavage/methylation domain-containing protein